VRRLTSLSGRKWAWAFLAFPPAHFPHQTKRSLVTSAATLKSKGPGAFVLPAHAISTKNKHLLAIYSIPARGFTAAVSVFRGTPPPKPLNCKSVANRLGARLRSPCGVTPHQPAACGATSTPQGERWAEPTCGKPRLSCASIRLALSDIIKTSRCYRSQTVHLSLLPFTVRFREIKNPAYVAVSRVREIFRRSSEPAYTKSIQITFGPLPNGCRG